MKNTNSPEIEVGEELSLLKMEYERMSAEIRMYVEQYSAKFTIFGTFVLGGLVFALNGEDKFAFVFPVVPYLLLVIAGVTIAQAYIIACLAARVRQIEDRVSELNSGHPILQWESILALQLIYPPFLKVPRKEPSAKPFRGLNPVFGSVVIMILAIVPLVGFCLVKTWQKDAIPAPFGWAYIIITSILFLVVLWFATSFFRLGGVMRSLTFKQGCANNTSELPSGGRADASPEGSST